MDRIEFDPNELTAAEHWHGGQSSMLYAIASTGALSRGTIRPHVECDCNHGWTSPSEPCRVCKGAKMTDDQWLAHLAARLESEASTAANSALAGDRPEDYESLEGIASKCRAAVTELTGTFSSWSDVVAAARLGAPLWYHAPLDIAPRRIAVVRVFKNGKIRIDPMSAVADKFTADAGHLDRFRARP